MYKICVQNLSPLFREGIILGLHFYDKFMKKRSKLSETPRTRAYSRKIPFSIAIRKKISENWIILRKTMKTKINTKKLKKQRPL